MGQTEERRPYLAERVAAVLRQSLEAGEVWSHLQTSLRRKILVGKSMVIVGLVNLCRG